MLILKIAFIAPVQKWISLRMWEYLSLKTTHKKENIGFEMSIYVIAHVSIRIVHLLHLLVDESILIAFIGGVRTTNYVGIKL